MKSSPRVVEFVGLAGAGKSTAVRTLDQSSNEVLVVEPPYFRKLSDIPFFVWNLVLLLPTLLRLGLSQQGSSRWLNEREIAWMVILLGWHHRLRRPISNGRQVILLDQGPVFMLTMLYLHGPETLKSPSSKEWWTKTCKRWADTLDTVIWLDAADATLITRIRARKVWHGVKEKSDAEALRYLNGYRESYQQVISTLTASNNDLKILAIDTVQESLKGVVDCLLLEFGLKGTCT